MGVSFVVLISAILFGAGRADGFVLYTLAEDVVFEVTMPANDAIVNGSSARSHPRYLKLGIFLRRGKMPALRPGRTPVRISGSTPLRRAHSEGTSTKKIRQMVWPSG